MIALLLLLAASPQRDTVRLQWTPHRVFDARRNRFSDLEAMAAELAQADVVFFGEQHDDPGTHGMQRALLEAIGRRRNDVVLAMEMFERDVQPSLDDYLRGSVAEDAFLKSSRPWPNYPTDYRPLVEYARARGWTVIAGNVPRRIASAVSSKGLDAVKQLPDSARAQAAAEFICPHDDYFKRFGEAMGAHPMGSGATPSSEEMKGMTERFYQAQCVKDETMAESIVRARQASTVGGRAALVIHVNGDFHSDFGQGTAARVERRLPDARIAIVSAIPVASLDSIDAKRERKRAQWLVFTLKPPTAPKS